MILSSYTAENISSVLRSLPSDELPDLLTPGTELCKFTMVVESQFYILGRNRGFPTRSILDNYLADVARIVAMLNPGFESTNKLDFNNGNSETISFHPQQITGCTFPETLIRLIELVDTSAKTFKHRSSITLAEQYELISKEEVDRRFTAFYRSGGRGYLSNPADALTFAGVEKSVDYESMLSANARDENIFFLRLLPKIIADNLIKVDAISIDNEPVTDHVG